jgi:hypothetical protein
MNVVLRTITLLTLVVSVAGALPAAAQNASSNAVLTLQATGLTLQATGRFARGGEFAGTITINKFEQRGNDIVAVGFVQGTLHRGGRAVATGLAGEVAWPVIVSASGLSPAGGRAPATGQFRRISSSIVLAQADCPVVQIALGAVDVNILGVAVSLSPVALNLSGESGTPLGDLICAASALLGNVAGLVNVLNSILGLLTGLLGGLFGVIPGL